jgi:tetraacyldisaccharide 4'-kinase
MLTLLSKLYGAVMARRNARFDAHTRPIVEIDAPVISVGNISAGGTGKTPVVHLVVDLLRAAGRRPAVVLRGYRRRSRGLVVVHNGERILVTSDVSGDEAMLHAMRLNVPVVVSEDKVEAAAWAAGTLPCDVVVVDDGFQHRALHRDLDIVLVDEASLHGQLLPKGRLREPLTSLHRADVVLCMGAVRPDDVRPWVRREALVFPCRMETDVAVMATDRSTILPPGASVLPAAGIANPDRFVRSLTQAGYRVGEPMLFRDHHRYTKRDLDRLCAAAAASSSTLVVTDKDAVKLLPLMNVLGTAACAVYVLPLHAHVDGDAFASLVASRTQR